MYLVGFSSCSAFVPNLGAGELTPPTPPKLLLAKSTVPGFPVPGAELGKSCVATTTAGALPPELLEGVEGEP